MSRGHIDRDRAVLRVSGPEARDFLQGLVTNDVRRLEGGPLYAALLTPQGKYLFDFFLLPDHPSDAGSVLVDVPVDRAAALAQRLAMYRLRARVAIDPTDLAVAVGLGDPPPGAFADPRDPVLGWRAVGNPSRLLAGVDPVEPSELERVRIGRGVPAGGSELIPDDSYILEMGFERLNGVDFRKGCYVGQEVTARMKHKAELRKGLARVRLDGPAPAPGTVIESAGRPAGTLLSAVDGLGLAYLRFDRVAGPLTAGGVGLAVDP